MHEKKEREGEQDGGGVGGHELYFSPWIHQEHTFRHSSARRAQVENGQGDLTSGKEYIDPRTAR